MSRQLLRGFSLTRHLSMHTAGSIASDDGALHVDEAKAPGLARDGVHHHGRVQDGAKRLKYLPQRIIGDDGGQVADVDLAVVRQLVSGSLSWSPAISKTHHITSHHITSHHITSHHITGQGRMWCERTSSSTWQGTAWQHKATQPYIQCLSCSLRTRARSLFHALLHGKTQAIPHDA